MICCRGTGREALATMQDMMERLKLTVSEAKTRLCREISELTGRRSILADAEDRVVRLNRLMTGWANYFRLGPVSKAYRSVDMHARKRLRQWLCKKHKVRGRGIARFPAEYLYQTLGLNQLEPRTRSFPWANA